MNTETSNTSTDLTDLADRLDTGAVDDARGRRMPLDVLAQAANQWAAEGMELLLGYPGQDGTEWKAKQLLGGIVSNLDWAIRNIEETQMPKALGALNNAINREAVRPEYERRGFTSNDAYRQAMMEQKEMIEGVTANSGSYVGDSAMPVSQVDKCQDWVQNVQDEYDALQCMFHAVTAVYEPVFGIWVRTGQTREAVIDAATNPALAALMARANSIAKEQEPENMSTGQKLNRAISDGVNTALKGMRR
jgi:hypothetical protein